ncbi:hypothetical protein BX600DRAFT_429677 [Xylariales sp. PMI_506]|nr:hypothetical protein BX600DRAFT_429677 [Xylariales sp. PMI_506]
MSANDGSSHGFLDTLKDALTPHDRRRSMDAAYTERRPSQDIVGDDEQRHQGAGAVFEGTSVSHHRRESDQSDVSNSSSTEGAATLPSQSHRDASGMDRFLERSTPGTRDHRGGGLFDMFGVGTGGRRRRSEADDNWAAVMERASAKSGSKKNKDHSADKVFGPGRGVDKYFK